MSCPSERERLSQSLAPTGMLGADVITSRAEPGSVDAWNG
jgi:hypothetical protein